MNKPNIVILPLFLYSFYVFLKSITVFPKNSPESLIVHTDLIRFYVYFLADSFRQPEPVNLNCATAARIAWV